MPDSTTLADDAPSSPASSGGQPRSPVQPDLRARQRAVVLAFGRRPPGRADASSLMRDAIELIAETLHLPVHAIADIDCDRKELRVRASATRGLCELDDASFVYPLDPTSSLVGHALSVGQPVVSSQLASDARFCDSFLPQLGVVAGFALPLVVGGDTIGALAAFSRQPQEFAAEDVDFAESLAQLLAVTLGRVAAEEALARSQATLDQFWNSTDSLLLITDWSGQIAKANSAAERTLGRTSESLRGHALVSLVAEPSDVEAATRVLRQATQSSASLRFQCTVRGDENQLRLVRWTVAALPNERSVAESVLFDGTDITNESRLAREVEQTQAALQSTQAALAKMVAAARGDHPPADAAAQGDARPTRATQPFQAIESPEFGEQRDSQRRAFPYRQLVAPMRTDKMPGAADFQPLQFRDISATGVSFFAPTRPDFQRAVIRLGSPPNVHFVVAEVMNATQTPHFGRTMFLVGCRFVERISATN